MRGEVIDILSDSEEDEVVKSKEFLILQKQIKDDKEKRKSTASLIIAVNMQFIQGNDQEKDFVLTERIKKMFIDKAQFDASKDYFCLKREPNYNMENCHLSLSQIMIFGADFWTTKQIKTCAKKLNIQVEVVKIDDTHKKLKFADFFTAKKWLEFNIKDKKIFNAKIEEEDQSMILEDVTEDQKKLKGWFELEPYTFQGFTRLRQARFCTTLQKDIEQLIQNTKTTSYAQFKKLVETELFDAEKQEVFHLADERNRQNRIFRHSDSRYFSQSHRASRGYHSREMMDRRRNYGDSNFQNEYHRGEYGDYQKGNYRCYKNKNGDYSKRSSYKDRYQNGSDHSFRDRSRNKRVSPKNRDQNIQREHTQNRSMMNQSVAHTISMDPKYPQNNTMLEQIQNENLSFLLDNVHNDASITKVFNQMKIENGNNDMSIEIASESHHANESQDLSVILDDEVQIIQIPKYQPVKELRKDKKDTQRKKSESGKSEQNKRAYQFNYLAYLEDSQRHNQTVKVVQFRGRK